MTLYRKYRPATFGEVVGRDSIKKVLTQELKTDNISHAYLFSGTRGTGKTSIARILAKALNCESRDKSTSEPCNTCSSCVSVNESKSQDLVEIDAASNRRIEEIRELREHVKYVPTNSKYKVYIVDEVHMLTPEAFNALLKTLEEPPSHVVFILATTELHKIPETIFSRCQHFSFGKLRLEEVVSRLTDLINREKAQVDSNVVLDIARRSGGALRDAESLLGQILSIGVTPITQKHASLFLPKVGFGKTIKWLSALVLGDASTALKDLSDLEDEGVNLHFFLQEALEVSRQMVLFGATQDSERLGLHFSPNEVIEVELICKNANAVQLRKIVLELLRASQDMKLSSDMPILPIELAVVELCVGAIPVAGPAPVVVTQDIPKEQDTNPVELKKEPISPYANTSADRKTKTIESEPIIAAENPIPDPESRAPKPQETAGLAKHSLEEILDGWGEVLTKAKNKSQALNFVLGVAKPVGLNGAVLELGFKYKLQQEKVSEIKNRDIVETIIKEVYGSDYRIDPTLRENIETDKHKSPPKSKQKEDELLKATLEVFEGAEVLN